MPNHCQNKLTIEGDYKDLIKFTTRHFQYENNSDECELDFKTIISPPQTKEYETDGWYEWNCNNWGCKWNAWNTNIVWHGKKKIEIYFTTAWSPSEPIIHKLIEMYPKLKFTYRYFEAGSWFGGSIFEDGSEEQIAESDLEYFMEAEGFDNGF